MSALAPAAVTGLSGSKGVKVVVIPALLVMLLAGMASPLLLLGAMGNTGALPGVNFGAGSGDGGGGGSYGPGGSTEFNVEDSTFVDKGGAANAWGGYDNGRIPASELCPVPWSPGNSARCDAVKALTALNNAYKAKFGGNIQITDAYRSYEDQVAVRASWCARGSCYMAAEPGTSNHGWALAFDLGGGINQYGSAQYAWMKTNAGTAGFFHPTWAEPGHPDYEKPEPWHWQFVNVAPPAGDGGGGAGGGGTSDGTPAGNRALGQQMAAARGWAGAEWTCLEKLWTRESGWNQFADNPTSSAYGIPQALPGSKMASAGGDWKTNPATQITWGLGYISGRYGTPCKAWAHSESVGWY